MKKTVALLLIALLVFATVPAFAAGKLSVVQENFHVISGYSMYGYAYAKVQNVGDKRIDVNAALLEIYDENGDALTSTDYFNAYARYIEPDDYTYVMMYDQIEDIEDPSVVDDYLLTITGKAEKENVTKRLNCTVEYLPDVDKGYYSYDYINVTFTNETDAPVSYIRCVVALLDVEGNILYVSSDSIDDDQWLHPNGTMTFSIRVDSDFTDYFEANNIVPDSADAIVYVYDKAE